MPPKTKTAAEKRKARLQILDAARELFVAKGIEAVTMREIAKKIAHSPTTIYLHFADKETLIHELCQRDFEALGEELNGIMQIKLPVERMVALGNAYAHFALTNPNHYRMLFMTTRTECVLDDGFEENKDAYQLLLTVVGDVYKHDYFLPELKDPALIAQTIWAGIHGVCALQISLGEMEHVEWSGIEDRVQLMLATLTRGLIKYTNYKSKL